MFHVKHNCEICEDVSRETSQIHIQASYSIGNRGVNNNFVLCQILSFQQTLANEKGPKALISILLLTNEHLARSNHYVARISSALT